MQTPPYQITSPHPTGDGPQTLLPHQERIPSLRLKRGRYEMYFARTVEEREAIQRLRFEVFCLELGEGLHDAVSTGLDRDPFDDPCQHLIVYDNKGDQMVGTYRMQTWDCAQEGLGFYTDQEFDLGLLGTRFGRENVELGRACVAKEHRGRAVLLLLWQGLMGYLDFHGKGGFFGCSSLTSQDMDEGLRLYAQLQRAGHIHPELRTVPRPNWTCKASGSKGSKVAIPKLFRSYLRQGAMILSPPAIDREFGTIDFLTFVQVDSGHKERFDPTV
ncbi:MAG: GNAT family N-acetyltransferase [Planctomycetota bacterium]|nr:GNAT family N-acetyltransferase [Planctomycetota bacterium]